MFKSPFDVAQLLAPGDPYGIVDQLRPLTKAVTSARRWRRATRASSA